MLCVLDASVALAWAFQDEVSPYAAAVIGSLRNQHAAAPAIWPLDVTNAIAWAVRRGRIDALSAFRLQRTLDTLPLDIDAEFATTRQGRRILQLAVDHGLSSYDASYLELALSRGLPLATQDARLARAAADAGVTMLRP